MPAADRVPTVVEKPWEDERDSPSQVVRLLAGEAGRRLGLSTDVQARLEHRVVAQEAEILGQATAEQAAYERARAEHLPHARRAPHGALWRRVGGAVEALGLLGLATGPFLFAWHGTTALGLPPVVRILLLPVPAVLLFALIFVLRRWSLPDLLFEVACLPLVVMVVGGIGWQCHFWIGDSSLFLGVAAAAIFVLAAMFGGGWILKYAFSDLHWSEETQHAFDQWLEALYGRGILPVAAQAANDPGPVYRTSLHAPAVSYVDPRTAVDFETAATAEVRRLLNRAVSSVALAGPRGAGKTTLMNLWCAGRYLDHLTEARHLAVKVNAPVGYEPKEFLVHLFGRVCDAVEDWLPAEPPAKRRLRLGGRTPLRRPGRVRSPEALRELARYERRTIRTLRSRTTEHEVALELTVRAKLAGRHKRSVKLDDLPLGHPELVDRFREFLSRTAEVVGKQRGKVLIGVDELDRISDAAQAERFLNELKAVFDVPNCSFLVSVSDEALADFELAAMGMRTAFDSAFDAVVRVDYLTFGEARTLLNRRVVDLPEQFAALAYVLSGGLARELVRIVEVISARGGELREVAELLVRRQLDRTLRAARDRLTRSADRRAGAKLALLFDEPVSRDLGALAEAAREAQVGTAAEETRLDVVVMIEYLAVLLEVFDDRLDEARMRRGLGTGPGGFGVLAKVRRYIGANPYSAQELLIAFRKAWA